MPEVDAQPYAFKFTPATAALVIVDMQQLTALANGVYRSQRE